jgi:hypothetical protein
MPGEILRSNRIAKERPNKSDPRLLDLTYLPIIDSLVGSMVPYRGLRAAPDSIDVAWRSTRQTDRLVVHFSSPDTLVVRSIHSQQGSMSESKDIYVRNFAQSEL